MQSSTTPPPAAVPTPPSQRRRKTSRTRAAAIIVLCLLVALAGFAIGFAIGQYEQPQPRTVYIVKPIYVYPPASEVTAQLTTTGGFYDALAMSYLCTYNYTVTVRNEGALPMHVNGTVTVYGGRNESFAVNAGSTLTNSQSYRVSDAIGPNGSQQDCPAPIVQLQVYEVTVG